MDMLQHASSLRTFMIDFVHRTFPRADLSGSKFEIKVVSPGYAWTVNKPGFVVLYKTPMKQNGTLNINDKSTTLARFIRPHKNIPPLSLCDTSIKYGLHHRLYYVKKGDMISVSRPIVVLLPYIHNIKLPIGETHWVNELFILSETKPVDPDGVVLYYEKEIHDIYKIKKYKGADLYTVFVDPYTDDNNRWELQVPSSGITYSDVALIRSSSDIITPPGMIKLYYKIEKTPVIFCEKVKTWSHRL